MLNSATQVYLLMYIMLFLSAIKIVFKGKKISWIILISALSGLLGISLGLIISLIPPLSLHLKSQLPYTMLTALFLLVIILVPLRLMQNNSIDSVSEAFSK